MYTMTVRRPLLRDESIVSMSRENRLIIRPVGVTLKNRIVPARIRDQPGHLGGRVAKRTSHDGVQQTVVDVSTWIQVSKTATCHVRGGELGTYTAALYWPQLPMAFENTPKTASPMTMKIQLSLVRSSYRATYRSPRRY
jgi:hypothetical protein